MDREDIIKMLECIGSHAFCEDANRDYDYCMEGDCTECQIDFCKRQLEEGKVLDLKGENNDRHKGRSEEGNERDSF